MTETTSRPPAILPAPDPRQEWATPTDFMDVLRDEWDFGLDVCATPHNGQAPYYYGPPGRRDLLNEDAACKGLDGLAQPWHLHCKGRTAFCNPGFSRILPWVQKAIAESALGCGAVLLTLASHAAWAKLALDHAAECRLLAPRVNFQPPPGVKRSSNTRDALLWVFRPRRPKLGCLIARWDWRR